LRAPIALRREAKFWGGTPADQGARKHYGQEGQDARTTRSPVNGMVTSALARCAARNDDTRVAAGASIARTAVGQRREF